MCKQNSGDLRNYGIDLLRICSMLMVIIIHILGQGGILQSSITMSSQYKIAYFFEIAACCAVDCYALISGYVGVYSNYKYTNFIILWLRVIFYTILITLLFLVFRPELISRGTIFRAFFPVLFREYWYFTAYFVLFLFIPILNLALVKLERMQLKLLLCIIFLVFTFGDFAASILFGDTFNLIKGYSAWWLIILYFFGGYIRVYGLLDKIHTWKWGVGYGIGIMITWLFKLCAESFNINLISDALINYTSPTIVFMSICLLQFFSKLKISTIFRTTIKWIAPLSFSVYIIHTHPLIFEYVFKNSFREFVQWPVVLFILGIILSAIIIFGACIIVDSVREKIFKTLGLKKRIEKLESLILKDI